MTHAGHSYHQSTPDGIAAVAEQERRAIVGAAETLRAAGIPCPIVSGGSTPTAMHSRDFTGITEMRPGVYVFNDLDQEFIGSCGAGRPRALGAGLGDRPLPAPQPAAGRCRRAGALQGHQRPGIPAQGRLRHDRRRADERTWRWSSARRSTASSARTSPLPYANLPVGSRVRVLPNHACITAAAYDRYYVVDSDLDGGKSVVDVYDRINGW